MVRGSRHIHVLLPVVAAIVGACGGLESPVGAVTGRIVGASVPGAYVYPLGRPDLKAEVQVDGTYRLEAVPTGVRSLVLYDGFPFPDGRAELVVQEILGGRENRIPDRFGGVSGLMPVAGTVLAAAVPDGGATPWRPTFNLPQTVHANLIPVTGGVYSVWPLPAGEYDVGALLEGFIAGGSTVTVSAATTSAAPVPLLVDLGATAPGCGAVSAAAPSRCENGLVCELADGRCYECTASDAGNCSSGCNLATRTCNAPAPAVSTWCSPCTSGSTDCESATVAGLYCRVSDGSTTGYCTRLCSYDSDCSAAGFKCDEGRCKAPEGCAGWIQTMGAVCYSDSRCAYYLARGWCFGGSADRPGYCTAPCAADADCRVATGATSTFSCVSGHCAPP